MRCGPARKGRVPLAAVTAPARLGHPAWSSGLHSPRLWHPCCPSPNSLALLLPTFTIDRELGREAGPGPRRQLWAAKPLTSCPCAVRAAAPVGMALSCAPSGYTSLPLNTSVMKWDFHLSAMELVQIRERKQAVQYTLLPNPTLVLSSSRAGVRVPSLSNSTAVVLTLHLPKAKQHRWWILPPHSDNPGTAELELRRSHSG